jgi:hypothetical protein
MYDCLTRVAFRAFIEALCIKYYIINFVPPSVLAYRVAYVLVAVETGLSMRKQLYKVYSYTIERLRDQVVLWPTRDNFSKF